MSDHQLAARLATEAGELLLAVRAELADATAAERKSAGDKRSHAFLMAALAIAAKDLRLEWRSRSALLSAVVFAATA